MTKIDFLRLRIKALNGALFTCKDVSNDGDINTHKFLSDMVENDEIEFKGFIQTRGRSAKVYAEKKLKPIKAEIIKKQQQKRSKFKEEIESPWKSIWPEFFRVPEFKGTSRLVINFEE